jgi:hypothetical protein
MKQAQPAHSSPGLAGTEVALPSPEQVMRPDGVCGDGARVDTDSRYPVREDEWDWLDPSGLDRAYAQLLWRGFCCSTQNAPEALNDQWVSEIQARLVGDGLRAAFATIDDSNAAMRGCGIHEIIVLCRLAYSDGTLPPDPAREEVGDSLLAHWGETLRRARERYPYSACPPRGVSEERIDLLEQIEGWTWDSYEVDWQKAYAALLAFVAREHTVRVTKGHREGDVNLESWVVAQRAFYSARPRQIGQGRIDLLEEVEGWVWDAAHPSRR